MKVSASRHALVAFAWVLCAINIAIFVIGFRWIRGVRHELATDANDGSVLKVVEEIDLVVHTMRLAGWVALVVGGVMLLAFILRVVKRASRTERRGDIRSYTKNLARARLRSGSRRRRGSS